MHEEANNLVPLFQVLLESRFQQLQLGFLKKMSRVSKNQKTKQPALIIFSIYQVKIKKNYAEAENCIFEAEQLANGNTYLNTAVLRMTKSMILTYLEQYQESLKLLNESLAFFKKSDIKDNFFKTLYIKMIPELIRLHNISTFRKKYMEVLENAYQIITNSIKINNQQIEKALKIKIQQISEKIACLNPKTCLKHLKDSESKDSKQKPGTRSSQGSLSRQKPAWKSPYYQQSKSQKGKINGYRLGGAFGVKSNQKIIKKRNLSPQANPYMLQKQTQRSDCRLI